MSAEDSDAIAVAVVDHRDAVVGRLVSWLSDAALPVQIVYAGPALSEVLAITPAPDAVVLDTSHLQRSGDDEATPPIAHAVRASGFALVAVDLDGVLRGVKGNGDSHPDPASDGGADGLADPFLHDLAGRRPTPVPVTDAVTRGILTGPDEVRPDLSGRELVALRLYTSGLTLDGVAARMNVSPHTVKSYLDRVRGKYEAVGRPARSKIALYAAARADGYLT